MKPLPFEKRVPGQRVVFIVTRENDTPIVYRGRIVEFPDGHPLKDVHMRDRDLVYVMPDSGYHWLNWSSFPAAWWSFAIENGSGSTSPLYAENEFEAEQRRAYLGL